ncbi:MAG: hypothetical protein AB1324_06175 [Candidatus Micrarchaeota archaeon]
MRLTALFLLLAAMAYAHDGGISIEELHDDPWAYLGMPDPVQVLAVASFLSGLAVFYSLFVKSMSEEAKTLLFGAICAPIALATIYLGATTVYMNAVSETGGPVHWHADFEVWACGERQDLIDPTGLDNKVGSPAVHEHNDGRIHIEGVLLKREEASLRNFFIQTGGNFEEGSLTIPTNGGVMTWSNGELCNGRPAKWLVFVNGELLDAEEAHDHILAPYAITRLQGGQGDLIKIVFTEKAPATVNAELGVEP